MGKSARGGYFDVIQIFLVLGIFAGGIGKRNGFRRSWLNWGTSGALGCLVEWLPGRVVAW